MYEGDVIKWQYGENEVEFLNGAFITRSLISGDVIGLLSDLHADYFEVIGNIYEN